ncbi:MAG TPA: chromosomal replication initiator protein DnaA [Syntrophorhabdaceae bacterium]|nr:chromosomal replication initiator protein DnaA [Syntrophorhabdaceae bacterium]HOL04906.1 chromosomal replication initiator protein DnaA [Syntrophorhabdaceae bacterium]HON84450.1 chromosomal replication initiator protein DnaA [Syntrophorhabdaceae bacterium]HOT41189.1 chromosomal replication initiator protein DnaA [Syntrophorhabdaceae bacterium]HPC65748.1 chromosomal replication initiator protein DnaA [Syntrophorhabdaceae bacterium]
MADLLQQIKPKVASIISQDSFKTWIEPIKFSGYKEGIFSVVVPNEFFKDWVIKNFEPILLAIIKDTVGQDVKMEYITAKEEKNGDIKKDFVVKKSTYNLFNPKYTFETFVVGSCNQFANAACLAVATNPGKTYNPLFIYGGVGLGKTHLLNAIGNFLIKHSGVSPEHICYITAEVFTNELINSLKYSKMDEFRNRFRKMDVLLIDDIQFIAGKDRTQEEFFHTFNTLYDNMKQVVVTCDKFPRDLENIEERLRSRFEWGLIADIQPPDIETKVAILNKKAEIENIQLPLDVAFYIASRAENSVRSLEGALIRIGAYASLHNTPIDIKLASEVMGHIIKEKNKEITIESIIKEVSSYFNIKSSDIKSNKRTKSIMLTRQIAIYLARKLTDSSLVDIGNKFGGKDHSTIIHSIKKIEEEIKWKSDLKTIVEKIETKLKSI